MPDLEELFEKLRLLEEAKRRATQWQQNGFGEKMPDLEELFERLRLLEEAKRRATQWQQNGFGAGAFPHGSPSSTPQISEINMNNFIHRAGVLFAEDPNDTYLHTRTEKIKCADVKVFREVTPSWKNFLAQLLKPLPLVTNRDTVRVINLGKAVEAAVSYAAGNFAEKLFGLDISSYELTERHQYPVYGDNSEVGWVRYQFTTSNLSATLTVGSLSVGGCGLGITCRTEYFVFESFEALEEAYKEMKSGR